MSDDDPETRNQTEIINDLSLIDQLCQVACLSAAQVSQLHCKVREVLGWIDRNIRTIETDVGQQLLDFLRVFSEAKDFERLFEDPLLSFLIYINSAFLVQQSWRDGPTMNENYSFLKKAIQILKKFDQGIEIVSERELFLKHKVYSMLMRIYLQLAASYSQFGLHKKALKVAKKSFSYLSYLCINAQNMFQGNDSLGIKVSPATRSQLSSNEPLKSAMLNFFDFQRKMNQAIEQALNGFEICDPEYMDGEGVFGVDKVAFRTQPAKSDSDQFKNVTIANFMHIECVTLEKVSHQPALGDIFNEENFLNMVMAAATIMFAIATENRFICLENYAMGTAAFKIKSVFEKNHQQRIKKIKRFVFSERVHAQSISLLHAYLKQSTLINHLTSSFEKNYQTNQMLENIVS